VFMSFMITLTIHEGPVKYLGELKYLITNRSTKALSLYHHQSYYLYYILHFYGTFCYVNEIKQTKQNKQNILRN